MLIVRRGPNTGSRFRLDEGVTTIGRDPGADIFLDDITVSRRHAVIASDEHGDVIADQGSLNGTYLNGRRIEQREVLVHGDELQIGLFKIVYAASAEGASATAADDP